MQLMNSNPFMPGTVDLENIAYDVLLRRNTGIASDALFDEDAMTDVSVSLKNELIQAERGLRQRLGIC